MHLVETWMLSLRHKEEIEIVEMEMVTYIKFTRGTIAELENERDTYMKELLNSKRIEASSKVLCLIFSIAERNELNLCFDFQYYRSIMAKSFIVYEEVKRLRKLLLRACHAFQDDLFYNESGFSSDDE